MRNNKKGFTIVELVIVIAVIAILAGVLIPTFAGVINKANESKALQEAKNAYTNDLAALDAQVNVAVNKGDIADAVKSTDTAVDASKTYYTKNVDVYTKVASPTGNPSTSGYYEAANEAYVFVGEFSAPDAEGDYTYTYEADGYTCKYNGDEWSVEKND